MCCRRRRLSATSLSLSLSLSLESHHFCLINAHKSSLKPWCPAVVCAAAIWRDGNRQRKHGCRAGVCLTLPEWGLSPPFREGFSSLPHELVEKCRECGLFLPDGWPAVGYEAVCFTGQPHVLRKPPSPCQGIQLNVSAPIKWSRSRVQLVSFCHEEVAWYTFKRVRTEKTVYTKIKAVEFKVDCIL